MKNAFLSLNTYVKISSSNRTQLFLFNVYVKDFVSNQLSSFQAMNYHLYLLFEWNVYNFDLLMIQRKISKWKFKCLLLLMKVQDNQSSKARLERKWEPKRWNGSKWQWRHQRFMFLKKSWCKCKSFLSFNLYSVGVYITIFFVR